MTAITRKQFGQLALAMTATALVGGCARPQPAAPSSSTSPTTAPATAATPTPASTTKAVVGTDGVRVTIPADPRRIAALRPAHSEILAALGAKKRILLVDASTKSASGFGAFAGKAIPELTKLPTADVNNQVSVEELMKNAPDLIMTGGTSRQKDIDAIRKQTDIPLVVVHLETFDRYMDDIRTMARIVNAEQRGEQMIGIMQGTLDKVTARVKNVAEKDKVRVFYGVFDVYHAYGPNCFEDSQLTAAGGVNVAAKTTGWAPEVSAEQLVVWNPQVIIVGHYSDKYTVETVLGDSKLAGVSAVKNKKVYLLPDTSWEFSSPNAIFATEWMGTLLYPDRFKDVNIRKDADAFYQQIHGVNYFNAAGTDLPTP